MSERTLILGGEVIDQSGRRRADVAIADGRIVAVGAGLSPAESDHVLDATLSLARRPWSAHELRRQLWRQPSATLAVTARIHWQALKLFIKRVPFFSKPLAYHWAIRAEVPVPQGERSIALSP